VYNLEVETEHRYYVTALGVLGHNARFKCDAGGGYQSLKDAVHDWVVRNGLPHRWKDACYNNAMILYDDHNLVFDAPDYITRDGNIVVDGVSLGNIWPY
jgi:hypothetical protein